MHQKTQQLYWILAATGNQCYSRKAGVTRSRGLRLNTVRAAAACGTVCRGMCRCRCWKTCKYWITVVQARVQLQVYMAMAELLTNGRYSRRRWKKQVCATRETCASIVNCILCVKPHAKVALESRWLDDALVLPIETARRLSATAALRNLWVL